MNGSNEMPLTAVLARWDAIVIRWDLDPEERSALVGGFRDGPVDDVETYELICGERRMRLIVDLEPVLNKVIGDEERIRGWLRASNSNLGGRSPIGVMASSPEWMSWIIAHLGLAA
ncbi:antitoxin Xre/MbcA/ParS toxin-binding domain-containing protein [Sphingomonas faeni]|uniref:antitoxin Xre/MbcA/ParS toxin-binding domain-containing protein n=1 Tax=Sphingomonas faeni TaxID=185950 RepID=UPI0033531343